MSRISPRLVSVLVTGDDLDGFADAAPTSHLKVFLPAEGQDEPNLPEYTPDGAVFAEDGPPPTVRTYTPRRYDPASKTLEIQFLLHGEGPASAWAERAKPGDRLAVAGPGGRFSLEPAADYWWLAADESAIPAVGTLLDALPRLVDRRSAHRGRRPRGRDRLRGRREDQRSPGTTGVTTTLRRGARAAAREAAIPDGARIWVACEAAAMRDIRRYFTRERGIPVGQLVTRGYWRAGEQNHPDHDYGED